MPNHILTRMTDAEQSAFPEIQVRPGRVAINLTIKLIYHTQGMSTSCHGPLFVSFHPRMQSKVQGVTVVNDLRWRAWPGLVADVWDVECGPNARGHYISQAPRLFVLIEAAEDAAIRLKTSAHSNWSADLSAAKPLCFVPAGMPIWSTLDAGARLKHLDIHLDVETLAARFPGGFDPSVFATPRLNFADERLQSLSRLVALECTESALLHDLYADSLATALLTLIANVEPAASVRGSLSARQLRRITEFVDDHLARNVTLAELADLAGLSPSYFAQAFKASTGLPPHRWHMQRRVDRAKRLMETTDSPMIEIAMETGFVDQAHFTRVFRQFVGATPARWLRSRQG